MRASAGGSLFASAIVLCMVAGCSSRGSESGSGAAPAARATTRASAIAAAGPVCGGTDPALGAHPAHDAQRVPCAECHASSYGSCATAQGMIAFGALARANGATPSWDPATRTCSGVYCHGAKLRVPSTAAVAWRTTSSIDCSACHGFPPAGPHPAVATAPTRADCNRCHPQTVAPDGALIAAGPHANGALDFAVGTKGGWGCDACHAYPPATGAHAAHFDLADAAADAVYGDTSILADHYPTATPSQAPSRYAFACGNCHPLDPARHLDGRVDVELWSAAAGGTSLKARAAKTASFDPSQKTCSGAYCHSTGQAVPTFKTTPSWAAGKFAPETRCAQCHDDPPAYAAGNSHAGHVLGMPGVSHAYTWSAEWLRGSQHGSPATYSAIPASYASAGYLPPYDTTPMTCQTCHFDTVDPRNTTLDGAGNPVGYYYLHTTGNKAALCAGCHKAGSSVGIANGKALPLLHVNGKRDVRLDPRTGDRDGPAGQSLADLPWIPNVPGTAYVGVRKPTKPYWLTNAYNVNWGCRPGGQVHYYGYGGTAYCPPGAVWLPNYYYRDMFTDPTTATYCRNYPGDCSRGWVQSLYGTIAFSLENATYDPQLKKCSNVGCHLGSWSYPEYNAPTWGVRARNCFPCHRNP